MNFIKILINIVLFAFYSLAGIIIGNFFYGLYLVKVLGESVPNSQDEVHMRLAIFLIVLVLILTFLFRKYFYLSFSTKHDENEEEIKVVYNKQEVKTKKDLKEVKKEINKKEKRKEKLDDDDMEIYVAKEIK